MNIFDHLIKDTELIGIGPLNSTESTPGSESTTIVEYSFRVFTKSSSIVIYSPAFSKKQGANADEWLKKYLEVRSKVADQIGELKQNS
jgi:hypothetical protein